MSDNVFLIKPNINVKDGLQNIINDCEGQENATLIMGGQIFHLGCASDEQAVTDALWNIECAKYKLMAAAHDDQYS